MNITIKQIRAFVAVAEVKSFAAASELVHLSQPALSITIKNLEQSIGGQLFARSTRTLSLTPEGLTFLPTAKRLLLDFDDALKDLHALFTLQRGNLALAAMPSFASSHLPQHMIKFRQLYQTINIKIHDVIAEDCAAMVRADQVEFAISFDPGAGDELCFEPLFTDQLVVALRPDHPLMTEQQLTWQQLADYPFIALQSPSSIRLLIDSTLAQQNLFLNVVFEANQFATVGQMVATGLGISAIPSLYTKQMQAVGLECRPIGSPAISRRVGIITRKRSPLSQAAAAFVTLVREYY